jgi:HEPN domain-containing protein
MSATPDNNLADARRWLRQAEEQLAVAEWDAQGQFWAPACFHCQQAGELAVKAILIRQGERNLHVHSVLGLARRAAAYEPSLRSLESDARRLDRYYIGTRYPNGLDASSELFDAAAFEEARQAAAAFVEAARRAMASGAP